MAKLDEISSWLDENLADLAKKHEVVGAQVGVLLDGEIVDAATGLLSQKTGVEATTDSVFQIGSITKLWTTTLVMQLVDEGLVDLDKPVREYLPGFKVADLEASEQVTVRQMLNHTSGFEGDIFVPTTNDDDAVQRFVDEVMPSVPQNSKPGEIFSYNNAGFVVAGRIVEVLRDKPYSKAIRDHIVEPLGLETVAQSADEAILFRAAVGHIRARSDKPLEPAKVWSLVKSNAPAGSLLAMSARDLLTFAKASTSTDGALLTPASVSAVQKIEIELPPIRAFPRAWGLGWMLYDDWAGGPVIGHDGGTIGQASTMRIVPGKGAAVTVLTNGGWAGGLFHEVMSHCLRELADVQVPAKTVPPAEPRPVTDAERYVGRYEVQRARVDVTAEDGGLSLRFEPLGELAEQLGAEPETEKLVHLNDSDGVFVAVEPIGGMHSVYCFVGDDGSGRTKYCHGGRALPRVS